MKKFFALTLALVMMVQPMIASAVTWNELTTGLGSGTSYTHGDTTIEKNEDTTTVTGGTVEFDGKNWIGDAGKYVFSGVDIPYMSVGAFGNEYTVIDIVLQDGTYVGDLIYDASGYGNQVNVTNDATVDFIQAIVSKGATSKITENEGSNTNVVYGIANAGSKIEIDGAGDIGALTADLFVKGTVVYNGTGNVDHTMVYINTDSADTYSADQIKAIVASLNVEGSQTACAELWTLDENGNFDEIYEINEDGTLTFVGYAGELGGEGEAEPEPEEEPYDDLKAQREAEEALRQARGIGGVTTSIFWNKQMYLGHSTYNGRVYYQGKTEMTLQSLSWLPGGSANGKDYTLRINKENVNPGDVEIRLAQDILDVCKRAGIAQITIVDKNLAPIAQYAVSDLMAAREMYGLTADELICISADANAEVMKVTTEGEYLPIEPAAEEAAE